MHICFLTNEYPKEGFPHGGIGTFVKTLATALVKKGIVVSVVGLNYTLNNEEEIEDGVRIYRLKPNTIKMVSWYFNFKAINKKIVAIHKDNPIHIVESSELGLAFLTKIKEIKYIIRLHGGHHFFAESENRKINKWKGFQEKRSFKNSNAFIAVSQYVKNHTEKYLSYKEKPLAYINNPINTDLFQPIKSKIVDSKIVFVGTLCEKKGIRQLIQAFPFVKKEYPDATLEVYGRDWFFPDSSSYLHLLKEKELPQLGSVAKDIHFHGAISYTSIPLAYAEASVCVFPSHMETQGLVAPEAMAMEKPVVFTCLGPGPEVIEDGVDGFLVNPYDPKSIADKINKVFENYDRAAEIGKRARVSVINKFNPDQIVIENINFYRQIIK